MVFLLFELQGVEFFRVEGDVQILSDFVALDDVAILDLADVGDSLGVVDATAGRFVDLPEGDLGLGVDGGVDLDGDAHEGEAEVALPVGSVAIVYILRTTTSSLRKRTDTRFCCAGDQPAAREW
jgi:hypothetical protein